MNKKIVIVTGTGGDLGTGHFQRMANLAVSINKEKSLSASIFLSSSTHTHSHTHRHTHEHTHKEDILTERFKDILIEDIPQDSDLIIRDMRDSSIDEMESLKKIAPVLAIDDIGEGKNLADHTLYLLPTSAADEIKLNSGLFLYGYDFIYGIELLKGKKSIKKDIDAAIYLGFDPDKELVSKIKRSINKNISAILLANGRALSLTGMVIPDNIRYGEILCRSKIVITHFGITMFEAYICGCKIAALNPTLYHNILTDIIYDDFNILYMSDYASFAPDEMFNIIDQNLKIINDKAASVDKILKKIRSNNENFIKYISEVIYGTV
jgi:spore coat polysaccharide biosynthesis predicted glycosyltransferase SpsG